MEPQGGDGQAGEVGAESFASGLGDGAGYGERDVGAVPAMGVGGEAWYAGLLEAGPQGADRVVGVVVGEECQSLSHHSRVPDLSSVVTARWPRRLCCLSRTLCRASRVGRGRPCRPPWWRSGEFDGLV